MIKNTISTLQAPTSYQKSRSRGQFSQQIKTLEQAQISEFNYPRSNTKPKFSQPNSSKTQKCLNFPPQENWEANEAQWLPLCHQTKRCIKKELNQDTKLSNIQKKSGFYFDEFSEVSYKYFSLPETIRNQLQIIRRNQPNHELMKGYIQDLQLMYYILDKMVFMFQLEENFHLNELVPLIFDTKVSQVTYGTFKSQKFNYEIKNVLIVVREYIIQLFEIKKGLTKLQITKLDIEISTSEENLKDLAVTKIGRLFYLDDQGNLNQVADQKRFFKNNTIRTKTVEPGVISKIKSRISNNQVFGLQWISSLFSAIGYTFSKKLRFHPLPIQLLVDQKSKNIYSLINYKSESSSYYQIRLYSYENQVTLLRSLKQEEIIRKMDQAQIYTNIEFEIFKLSTVSPQLSLKGNLQIQFVSGVRIILILNELQLKVIKVEYPPNFDLIIKNPRSKILQKPEISSVDYSKKDTYKSIKILNTFNKLDKYSCVYLNVFKYQLQSYSEYRGYHKAPTVSKIPWVSFQRGLCSFKLYQLNLLQIQKSPLYNLTLQNRYYHNKNVYQLSEQIYNPPTIHLLLSDSNIQFSMKLRPIDVIFGIMNHFSLAEIKSILEQVMCAQITSNQLIVMLITITCNQELVCYVSSQINMYLQHSIQKKKFIVREVDRIRKEKSSVDIRSKCSQILEWTISYHISFSNRTTDIYNKESEEQKRPMLHNQIFTNCVEIYTSRIIQPLEMKTVDKIDENQCQIVTARLNEIHYLLSNKIQYSNFAGKRIKYFIVRCKQLLSILPKIRASLNNKLSFLDLAVCPSKFYEQYLFKGYIHSRFNHLSLWKEQRTIITKQLMIMFKVVDQIQNNCSLEETQSTLRTLNEIPNFFKEYLIFKKININLPQTSNFNNYFIKKIQEITQEINSIKQKKQLNNIEYQQALEMRKLTRMQYYLLQYFEQNGYEMDTSEVILMTRQQIEQIITSKCDILSNTIFKINYQSGLKNREVLMINYFKTQEHKQFKDLVPLIKTLFIYLQPAHSPLKSMIQCLITCFIGSCTFSLDSPKFFNSQSELKIADEISSLLLLSNVQQSKIIDQILLTSQNMFRVFTINPSVESNAKRMMISWMLSYYMLSNFVKQNHRMITQFKQKTKVFLNKINNHIVLMKEVSKVLQTMIEDLK